MATVNLLAGKAVGSGSKESTAAIRIIDSTTRVHKINPSVFCAPPIPGFDELANTPAWSFLIESTDGRKVVFDLAIPKEWRKMPPGVVKQLEGIGWDVQVEKDVSTILVEAGFKLEDIEAVIWSHSHFDHIGDPSLFPSSTDLVVGPGFKKEFMPGYPTNPESPLLESAWSGREVREISFEGSNLKAGDLPAFDYFGDGSLYLLDTPGHQIGHISALVRTTTNDSGESTFMFLGGDICHHGGALRPSKYLSLPSEVRPNPIASRSVCPGSLFASIQSTRSRKMDEPFFDPAMGHDIPLAIKSIRKAQEADGKDNVFFVFAHDDTLLDVVDFFPKPANEWKQKGWREQVLWKFLKDFEGAIKDST